MEKFFEGIGKFLFLAIVVGVSIYLKSDTKSKYDLKPLPTFNSFEPY